MYPTPTNAAVLAAAAVGTTRSDGTIKLVDPPASASSAYPLASYTYVIVPEVSPKALDMQASSVGDQLRRAVVRRADRYPPLPANVVSSNAMLIANIK